MEYIYAVLLLHKAKKEITEESVKKVLTSAGIAVDDAKLKGLLSVLKDINIEEAMEKAAMPVAAGAVSADAPKEEKAEEPEEEAVSEESAAEGLGSLFG
jgi:large subunit ribosomal protein L12